MEFDEVMQELARRGTPQTKQTYMRHGAPEPLFGVRIGDLKPLQKQLKGRQDVALALYATGNSDAMYLAGLVADGSKMTVRQLDQWAKSASWHMIAGCSVPWVAAEHPQAGKVAMKWTKSRAELVAVAGWATLSALVSVESDDALPIDDLHALLSHVEERIHVAANRVRYAMNNYIICVGTYVLPLAAEALEIARQVGKVSVDMGATDCKVPDAASYIIKSRRGQPVAAKRKTARC
ncbi:MAG: DNA alkylation repair protein [Planctomycetales bacterium]|nr:DNA alkylation repair protein [Planctomycetales bacterium]MCA9169924.1 DNA alkylation repair protein [Planctomycetales bacterium]